MESQKRKNVRLKDYDYSQDGAYFITVCMENHNKLLSELRRGDHCGCPNVVLTQIGEIAEKTFDIIENSYSIVIDKYVIMPNHIHFILIKDSVCEGRATARVAPTVGGIVGAYKSIVANEWLKICKQNNEKMGRLWQRNYHEHVIRNEEDYRIKWQYIDGNPLNWVEDEYYCDNSIIIL